MLYQKWNNYLDAAMATDLNLYLFLHTMKGGDEFDNVNILT